MHDDNLNPPAGRDEGAMARADLYKLANYSKKLFHLIHDDQELEGWVQAKITKAADYIASVYHYLEYEMKISEYGEKIENSDMYSESVKRAFQQKLFEARLKLKKMKEKEEKKIKEVVDQDEIEAARKRHAEKTGKEYEPKKDKKDDSKRIVKGKAYGGSKQKDDSDLEEAAKPDYLDFDKDGNKKEPMKAALKDRKKKPPFKKVKETMMAPSPDDGATAPPPKGPDGKYPVVVSGPHKGKRWSPQTPGPTNPAKK